MNLTKTTYTENSLALGTKAQDILSNAKSENTRKAYKTDVQKYLAWASTKDYTSEVVMIEYFSYLLNAGYKYSSVKRAKVALTSTCGIPRGAGGIPSNINLPSDLLSAAIGRSPCTICISTLV
jgi:hypothetical protein